MRDFIRSIPYFYIVGVYLIVYVVGEVYSKYWGTNNTWQSFAAALCTYTLATTIWLMLMLNTNELARMTYTIAATTMLATLVVAVAGFGERLTAQQYIGAALAFVALLLLSA